MTEENKDETKTWLLRQRQFRGFECWKQATAHLLKQITVQRRKWASWPVNKKTSGMSEQKKQGDLLFEYATVTLQYNDPYMGSVGTLGELVQARHFDPSKYEIEEGAYVLLEKALGRYQNINYEN